MNHSTTYGIFVPLALIAVGLLMIAAARSLKMKRSADQLVRLKTMA